MTIGKIMRRNLITLDMDNTLAAAKDLFDKHNMHHILVKDEATLVGVITDRDLWRNLSPTVGTRKETAQDSFILNKRVHLIMVRDLITATEDVTINEAVLLFYDHRISCLPIVDEKNSPIGIVTWRDIIKVIALQYRRKMQRNIEGKLDNKAESNT